MEKSYNGWTASKLPSLFGGLDNRVVPGTKGVRLVPGLRAGDVSTVLFYVAAQLHARVEAGEMYAAGDEWGYSYRLNRNANNLSCHSSGTAFDWNATRHPNGKRGTFTKAQVATIRQILDEVQKIVRWGGDFTGTPDEMHFEIVASPATVAMVAARLVGNGSAHPPITTLPVPVEEDMLSALSYVEQRAIYYRIMAFLRQRWYVVEGDTIREVADGTPGAVPASALDSLDGNYLARLVADGTTRTVSEVSSAFHQEADRDAANQAALTSQLANVGGDPESLAAALRDALGPQLAAEVASRLTISAA